MDDVSALRIHEVETYFTIVAGLDDEATIRARSWHNLATFTHDDYLDLAATLDDLGGSATFAFLGRDMGEYADTVEALHAEGQEIAVHGYRHLRGTDLPDEDVRENLERGVDAIEDATGVRPAGYFPPLRHLGAAGLDAASDLGLSWIFGHAYGPVPDGLDLVEPVLPYDMKLVRGSDDPETALEPLFDDIAEGASFLFHPNMLEYFGATPMFEEWLDAADPVSVSEQLESGGNGVVIDANRPLRIE